MASQKNKYYVVWSGREKGIFSSWEDCKKQVYGYQGASYKGFPNREEAEIAYKTSRTTFADNKNNSTTFSKVKPIITPSICVDAACSGNPGPMEYRGVWTADSQEIFRQGPFEEGTNNIGEFLAIVHALAMLKKNNMGHIPIYTDSATAMAWVRNKATKTKLEKTDKNQQLFDLMDRAILWLHNNAYTNPIIKWDTALRGEIPADFGRK